MASHGHTTGAEWMVDPPIRTQAAMEAKTLVIGDNGCLWYNHKGGNVTMEDKLKRLCFRNLTF